MEKSEEAKEPNGDAELETKEVDSETSDKKEGAVEKEVVEVLVEKKNKIEQRPFLTQSELLIKMKSGEEEEVKRCQIMIAATTCQISLENHVIFLSSGRIICCLLGNGVAIYCNRWIIFIQEC